MFPCVNLFISGLKIILILFSTLYLPLCVTVENCLNTFQWMSFIAVSSIPAGVVACLPCSDTLSISEKLTSSVTCCIVNIFLTAPSLGWSWCSFCFFLVSWCPLLSEPLQFIKKIPKLPNFKENGVRILFFRNYLIHSKIYVATTLEQFLNSRELE